MNENEISKREKIRDIHIKKLPVIYFFEDLILVDENITDEVNENILKVLKNHEKDKFDVSIYDLLDKILFTADEKYVVLVIEILEAYHPHNPEQK